MAPKKSVEKITKKEREGLKLWRHTHLIHTLFSTQVFFGSKNFRVQWSFLREMQIMDTVGLMLFMLHFPFIAANPFVPNLRGRQLQSGTTVVPRCKPGYKDVTNGQAFYWSCAFHCEGGAYYATTGCACACLTAEQEAIWRANGGTSQALQAPTSGNASSTVDVVTRPPQPTRAPSVPVVEIPVGEFGGESRWVPPKQSYTMPTMPTTPPEDTEDSTDRDAFSAHFGPFFCGKKQKAKMDPFWIHISTQMVEVVDICTFCYA